MRKSFVLILIICLTQSYAQDSLRLMYHNILNFPGFTPERVDSLRQILLYAEPDIYVVNELQSAAGANLILNDGLNVFGESKYQMANFVNGPDTDNGLFYNSNKLGLISQDQIGTELRDISVYKMYYKAPNLNTQTDTIYFYFFSCHLKAGSTEYNRRNLEAKQLKYYLNSIANEVENVFVGGDFNFYSAFESGCLTIKNEGVVELFDPIDETGNWSGDFNFADVHTQSTRNSNGVGGDGSGGGMDDRFDLIFVSDDVFDNSNGVTYLNDSYTALGQDGIRFNSTVIFPNNTAVPDSVANALYWASDHLPVMMTVVLDETASTDEKQIKLSYVYDQLSRKLQFKNTQKLDQVQLFNMNGELVWQKQLTQNAATLPHSIANGIYVWRVFSKNAVYSDKLIVN